MSVTFPIISGPGGQPESPYPVIQVDQSGNYSGGGGTGASSNQVQGTAADGSSAIGNPVQFAGKDAIGNIQTVLTGTDGSIIIQGTTAGASPSSGNPIAVGVDYNTTPPTYTNGQRVVLQGGSRGSLNVTLFGADSTTSPSVATSFSDGQSNPPSALVVKSYLYAYNGSTNDRVRADANGTITQPYSFSSATLQYAGVTGGITDTADVAIFAAAGASVRNYLTSIQFHNSSAIASEIVIKDGATVIWRGYAPAAMVGMTSIEFPKPLRGTANTALNVAMITTATATRLSAQGFTGT